MKAGTERWCQKLYKINNNDTVLNEGDDGISLKWIGNLDGNPQIFDETCFEDLYYLSNTWETSTAIDTCSNMDGLYECVSIKFYINVAGAEGGELLTYRLASDPTVTYKKIFGGVWNYWAWEEIED